MNAKEILRRYAAGERDFRLVNLERVKLRGANLSEADFTEANLISARLQEAKGVSGFCKKHFFIRVQAVASSRIVLALRGQQYKCKTPDDPIFKLIDRNLPRT